MCQFFWDIKFCARGHGFGINMASIKVEIENTRAPVGVIRLLWGRYQTSYCNSILASLQNLSYTDLRF